MIAGFTSCSHDDDVYDPNAAQKDKAAQYQQAFEAAFGSVNRNVNWGFDDQAIYTIGANGEFLGTRGLTRATNTNNNQWGMYLYVPEEMTAEQKAKVKDYFDKTELHQGISVNWSEFFVHQVSQTEKGTYMNYLYCGMNDFNAAKRDGYNAANTHVNNFNGGSSTANKNVGYAPKNDGSQNCYEKNYTDGIMYVYNSSSEMFGFYNSYDSKFYSNNFIMISGEMIDAAIPSGPSVAGMYFVGFDYEHDKTHMGENDVEKRDWKFNDWVIRVSPGTFRGAERVMAEDLIDSDLNKVDVSDWDFNDAVFDVVYVRQQDPKDYQNHDYAIITLWAAGGTKSLTVAGKEVHQMFGQPVSKMINTNATNGVDGLPEVIFRVDLGQTTDWNKTFNANDIPVIVEGTELQAKTGEATQKFEVPTNTRWMKERKNITDTYYRFQDYVRTNSPLDWYASVQNIENLY